MNLDLDPGTTRPAAFNLRTARLALREFADGDAADVMALHRAPRLRDHLVDDHPLQEPTQAALFIERIQRFYRLHPGLGIWHTSVLSPSAPPRFAGWFSLMPLATQPGEVELGSRLHPTLWGHGLAMDGGEALLDHAFSHLGLRSLWGLCHPHNRGARLCLAALGFGTGALAPYEGGMALQHHLDAAHWRCSRRVARRERLRRAAAASRESSPLIEAGMALADGEFA
jgi:RimJ/RimL family protein N-acetyltransferase